MTSMLARLHDNRPVQLGLGLVLGICFGVLLQRGGLTEYEVLMGQLRLYDWTVAKVILSAILVGMIGVHALQAVGLARLAVYPGSIGGTMAGGLIFGAGFGLLGYCPGTLAGAVGSGSLHGLLGGVPGMILGSILYAHLYPEIEKVKEIGVFRRQTLPELVGRKSSQMLPVMVVLLVLALVGLHFLDKATS